MVFHFIVEYVYVSTYVCVSIHGKCKALLFSGSQAFGKRSSA